MCRKKSREFTGLWGLTKSHIKLTRESSVRQRREKTNIVPAQYSKPKIKKKKKIRHALTDEIGVGIVPIRAGVDFYIRGVTRGQIGFGVSRITVSVQ